MCCSLELFRKSISFVLVLLRAKNVVAQLEAFKSLDNRTSIPWGAVNYQKFTQSCTYYYNRADDFMLLKALWDCVALKRGRTSTTAGQDPLRLL